MLKQENKYILEIKKTVIALLKDEKVKVMLFGLRARGNNYPYLDVDIGILPMGKFDEKKVTFLKEIN